jgi:hypothetical protein
MKSWSEEVSLSVVEKTDSVFIPVSGTISASLAFSDIGVTASTTICPKLYHFELRFEASPGLQQ